MTRLNRSFLAACGWMTVPVLAISSLVCVACAAEKPAAANPAEAAIRATADAFVQAFNRGDAKAVAALWTAEGSVLDDRGATIKGRKAIEGQYAALFKAYPGATMEVTVSSVEFPAPSVALENGVARVIHRDGPPVASRYTAIHVLEGGKWLMANVRETAVPLASGPGRLEALSWLIGSWTAKTEGVTVQTTFRWIANKSFIQRDYSVQQKGAAAMSGTQIIGWDPQENRLRSWTFDSSGGHGTSLWSARPDGWLLESSGMLSNGAPTASRELLIRVHGEDSVFGWRSFDRRVGTTSLPDLREVVLDRVVEKR